MRKCFIFLLIIFLSSCALRSYKKKLSPALLDWYKQHEMLMTSKVPTWINGRFNGAITERKHFLTLPTVELQREYKRVFWEIRYPGLQEVWEWRRATCNLAFTGEGKPGWKTDRGYVFMKFGFPHHSYTDMDRMWSRPPGTTTSIEGETLLFWEYFSRRRIVRYAFEFTEPSGWRLTNMGIVGLSAQAWHHKEFVKLWSPTQDGRRLWGGILLTMIKEGNNGKRPK